MVSLAPYPHREAHGSANCPVAAWQDINATTVPRQAASTEQLAAHGAHGRPPQRSIAPQSTSFWRPPPKRPLSVSPLVSVSVSVSGALTATSPRCYDHRARRAPHAPHAEWQRLNDGNKHSTPLYPSTPDAPSSSSKTLPHGLRPARSRGLLAASRPISSSLKPVQLRRSEPSSPSSLQDAPRSGAGRQSVPLASPSRQCWATELGNGPLPLTPANCACGWDLWGFAAVVCEPGT